jgi:hypothetical protein
MTILDVKHMASTKLFSKGWEALIVDQPQQVHLLKTVPCSTTVQDQLLGLSRRPQL